MGYLRFEGSDDRPLVTFFDATMIKRKGTLRFDNRLHEKEEIFELILYVWERDGTDSDERKVNDCQRELIKWAKEQNLNSGKLLRETHVALELALS